MRGRIAALVPTSCAVPGGAASHAAVGATAAGTAGAAVARGRVAPDVEVPVAGRVPPPGLPFSGAVRHGDTLRLSGRAGIAPGTLRLAPRGLEAEARRTLDDVRARLAAHALSMRDVVKCTVTLAASPRRS